MMTPSPAPPVSSVPAPFFSIVVPCCDVEPHVAECFDSVLAQPFGDWELLAVVETSRDRTEEIVRSYAARDPRIRVAVGPRTGSCSVPRNRGIELARGDYVVFLDGDDTLVPGSLPRLRDLISARPGADLYPCALQVHNDLTGLDEELRDNYPPDASPELSGPDATLLAARRKNDYPHPQMQLTVFRRAFLLERALRCVPGLRHQDSEFSPRALYLARRVVPLHLPFYVYRIHNQSVQTLAKSKSHFLRDYAIGLRSLLAFHAQVSREPGFNPRVADCWRRGWLTLLFLKWFSADFVKSVPRAERRKTLRIVFADGTADFDALLRGGSRQRRLAGWLAKAFVFRPPLAGLAEFFFSRLYFPLAARRSRP